MSEAPPPRGAPGGIALPALIFSANVLIFLFVFARPGAVDLGPNINPAGVAVIFASLSFLWLLFAIAKRPPPDVSGQRPK